MTAAVQTTPDPVAMLATLETATLETIDTPLCDLDVPHLDLSSSSPGLSSSSSASTFSTNSPRSSSLPTRVSRLAPAPTVPFGHSAAGPSTWPQRFFYIAVRTGHQSGVFVDWTEAQRQVMDHPQPVYKTFSTRHAAEAFVKGWEGAGGRHSLPGSCPRPLREHLAMTFPNSVPLPASSSNRPSYHSRLLCSYIPSPAQVNAIYPSAGCTNGDALKLGCGPNGTPVPVRHSLVRISSPLRCQVDDDDEAVRPSMRKTSSLMGLGGLLSPPSSPTEPCCKPPPAQGPKDVERRRSSIHDLNGWSASANRNSFNGPFGLPTPPQSPPTSPAKPPLRRPPSGLWADTKPTTPSSLGKPGKPALPEFELAGNAPKFSRSGLKKSGVVMPVSAPRPAANRGNSLPSLKGKGSVSSLRNGSSSSLNSTSSSNSNTMSRTHSRYKSQDRLASLAETSRRELQLNKEGLLALDALSPPRPGFLRSDSNSSISSVSSAGSSHSTAPTSISFDRCDSPECITEEPEDVDDFDAGENLPISCTKSDADADGSVESSSMKSGAGPGAKKKGGLFKRLSKALKLEKKAVPGQEFGRRGSL